jgi:hypothetical protein
MSEWRDDLTRSLAETLEQMAFMLVEPAQEPAAPTPRLWARLPLVQPLAGIVGVEMDQDLAARLVVQATGQSAGDPSLLRDAVAELANTLAGRFLHKRLGTDTEFQLGLPLAGAGVMPSSGLDWKRLEFQVDEGRVAVLLTGPSFS